MKATIDVKTPAGKSLEGFPVEFKTASTQFHRILRVLLYERNDPNLNLHPGDTITITIKDNK